MPCFHSLSLLPVLSHRTFFAVCIPLADHFNGIKILCICDSWFGNNGLFKPAQKRIGNLFDLLSRLRSNIVLYSMPPEKLPGQPGRPRKYGNRLGSCAEMAATFKAQASKLRVFRKTQWVALFSTDLDLSIKQIIEYYGARWKIESGFKEIKQEIGSSKSQTRNAHAVITHINFSMMAATIIWIYGTRLENTPERRHKVRPNS